MKKNPMHLLLILFGLMAFMSNTANAQTFTLEECVGDNKLNNLAEVTAAAEVDTDSTPNNFSPGDATAEDDAAQRCTEINALIDLRLDKVVSRNVTLDGICTVGNSSSDPRDDPANCDGDDGKTNVIYCDDQIEYTLTLSNAGPSQATGVAVEDVLPGKLAYVSSAPVASSAPTITTPPTLGGTVTWTGLTVDAGGSVSLTIVADVTCS